MRLWVLTAIAAALPTTVSAQVYVQGYTTKNGTYVAPHYRSSPDSSVLNNWSTRGNVNPYTGQVGTRNPYSSYNPNGYSSYGNYPNPYSSPYSSSSTQQTCLYSSPC